jgi:hypothetical protein
VLPDSDIARAAQQLMFVPEERITTVWQAIALHTSLGVAHKFGTEQAIVQMVSR